MLSLPSGYFKVSFEDISQKSSPASCDDIHKSILLLIKELTSLLPLLNSDLLLLIKELPRHLLHQFPLISPDILFLLPQHPLVPQCFIR